MTLIASARLERIVRENFAVVWRLARRWGLSAADSDDVAQRTIVVAARHLARIGPGKERAFLCRTAIHLVSNVRRSSRQRAEEAVVDWEGYAGESPDPEMLLHERRAQARLDAILQQIPEPLRAVFVLFELELLTQVEVAEALEIPQGTVASRLRRARGLVATLIERSAAQGNRIGGCR